MIFTFFPCDLQTATGLKASDFFKMYLKATNFILNLKRSFCHVCGLRYLRLPPWTKIRILPNITKRQRPWVFVNKYRRPASEKTIRWPNKVSGTINFLNMCSLNMHSRLFGQNLVFYFRAKMALLGQNSGSFCNVETEKNDYSVHFFFIFFYVYTVPVTC